MRPDLRRSPRSIAGLRASVLLCTLLPPVCGCKQPQQPAPTAQPPLHQPSQPAAAEEPRDESKLISIFCGAAGRPAIEQVANAFEKEHGVVVARAYSGSGTVLSQMIIGETGDVYIPGSDDFMDIAEEKGVIVEGTRKIACYLVPGIAVQKGNPKGIKSLDDLTRPGIKVGIGNPKAVCLGDIALKILDQAGLTDKVEPNIVTHADSCGQVANLLKLREVDAVIGWDVFASWAPEQIDFVPVPKELARPRHIPAAVTKFTKNPELARKFVDFIARSEVSREAFRRHGYTVR